MRFSDSRIPIWVLISLFLFILFSACQARPAQFSSPTLAPSPELLPTTEQVTSPVASPTPGLTPSPEPTLTPTQPSLIWIDPALPAGIQAQFILPTGLASTADREAALFTLAVGDKNPIGSWIFALAAAFPTIQDGVSGEDLRQAWLGQPSVNFPGRPLVMAEDTLKLLSEWWGKPGEGVVHSLPSIDLETYAWDNRSSWAILPFEELNPRWKVLEIDGQSPLRKDFDPQVYALALPLSLSGPDQESEQSLLVELPRLTNRDPNRLTTLILTGVTALVRGTALTMESQGVLFPGEEIAPWLRQADFTHINNEVPFFDQCPAPVLYPDELRFCSNPKYIQLLEDIGADIIELTGDHFSDYGEEALKQTLQMYQEEGWYTYGGGATAADARKPVLLEHNGNRLAILGCNSKGIAYYAQASDTHPGAVACDFDLLTSEIKRLKDEGYLVIVTFQGIEYFSYVAQPTLVDEFRQAASAGATIVSGSQAHQPHGMEFYDGSFIHYGLGNLFFDQYRYLPGGELDRAFIDRHIFYNGRYIGTELLTIQFVDLARSRPTTSDERQKFLKIIFTASGW